MTEIYTVLIVDDEPAVVTAMSHTLSREGYRVLAANNGAQALELAAAQPPDLILCDYMMPGMNGVEVFQEMARICPDAIRILVTGQADLEVAMSAINDAGVYKFILKPWNTNDFNLMVRRALEHYQLIQEGKALMQMLDMALRQQEVKNRGLQHQVDRYRRMLGMGN
jgi:response regulator RpfG family c-di-GMP phosphodiesterase